MFWGVARGRYRGAPVCAAVWRGVSPRRSVALGSQRDSADWMIGMLEDMAA